MIDRRVVDDKVHDDTNSAFAGLTSEADKVARSAKVRINSVIVQNIVSLVSIWTGVKRHQPNAVGAQIRDMIEAMSQAGEIAKAVAIRIHEGLHVNAINNRILVPEIEHCSVEAK